MKQPVFFALIALTLVPALSFAAEQDVNGAAAAATGTGIVAGTAGAIDLGHNINLIKEDKEAVLKAQKGAKEARLEANELAKLRNARAEEIASEEIKAYRKKYYPLYGANTDSKQFLPDSVKLHKKLMSDPEYARLDNAITEKLEKADAPLLLKITKKSRSVVRGAGLMTAGAAAYVYGVSEITQEQIEEPHHTDAPLVQEEATEESAPAAASAELQ